MCWKTSLLKVVVVVILISLLDAREGFQSQEEIRKKAANLYEHKDMFIPNVKYNAVKNKIPWIDPVVFDDMYRLSLKKSPTLSELHNLI